MTETDGTTHTVTTRARIDSRPEAPPPLGYIDSRPGTTALGLPDNRLPADALAMRRQRSLL